MPASGNVARGRVLTTPVSSGKMIGMTGKGFPPAVLDWLLEGDDPSLRFFTFTELLGSSPGSPEAAAARREIMTSGAVPRILAAQGEDGHWEGRDRFYTGKYRGTVWSLIILAELGADGGGRARAARAVRRSCATRRTASRAASPTTAPRRTAAGCPAASSPA